MVIVTEVGFLGKIFVASENIHKNPTSYPTDHNHVKIMFLKTFCLLKPLHTIFRGHVCITGYGIGNK
ncbi:MAG: hypothetical protein VKN72_25980 [Nostocales cyanobacterium 94392]|nr:hypothetical protein [Nostocales cyanobacterium 94392]